MGLQTYIKKLADYVSGASGTFGLGAPAITTDTDPADSDLTIGAYNIIYRDTFDNVSVVDYRDVNGDGVGYDGEGDGTGVAELWRYRTQFEINPNTTGTYPTSPGVYPGRAHKSKFSLKEASKYLADHTLNHNISPLPPYKFSNFRGAEAFFLTFVNGLPESEAIRVRNWCTPNPLRWSCMSWSDIKKWWNCGAPRWLRAAVAIVVGVVVAIATGGAGATVATSIITGTSMGVGSYYTMKADKYRCWRYTYLNNGQFTVQVHGGYSPVGKFLVTLSTTRGIIAETVTKEQTNVTFTNLKGSENGQDGINIGSYTLRVQDVITKKSYDYAVYVPYMAGGVAGGRHAFGIKASKPNILYKYPTGGSLATVFTPNSANAHWAYPDTTLGTALTGILQDVFQTVTTACNQLTVNLAGTIVNTLEPVNWRFSWRKHPPFATSPPVGIAPLTMTPVGPWTLEPNVTFNKMVTAAITTGYDAASATWQLELSSPTKNSIITNMISEGDVELNITAGDIVPAYFRITNESDEFEVGLDFVSVTQLTKTPTTTLGVFNYTVRLEYAASSCDSIEVEAFQYTGNKNDTWWDGGLNTAFFANSSTLPPAADRVGPVLFATLPGNRVPNTGSTFIFTLTNRSPGDVFTYTVRAKPATAFISASFPNNGFTPTAYYTVQSETDPVTGAITTTEVENYKVLTLT